MWIRSILCYFFSVFCHLAYLPIFASAILDSSTYHDGYIHTLASLLFHTQEREKHLANEERRIADIAFTDEEIAHLWNKTKRALDSSHRESIQQLLLVEKAYQQYISADEYIHMGDIKRAQTRLHSSSQILKRLWEEAIDCEEEFSSEQQHLLLLRKRTDSNFKDNPYLTSEIRQHMEPHLIPLAHPMRSVLDFLFTKARITQDAKTFYHAGFKTIAKGPRSYIRVAKHEKLPGYLVKVYLDTELKEKYNKKSWQWLVMRCVGAKKVRTIIKQRHIQHFIVADKWIYCLPPEPSPPLDTSHTRHLALLLVTDMDLTSDKRNYHAWHYYIKEDHLNELYAIISRAKGSSYRPDNIAFTNNGKFAFIDTEYPTKGPDFNSIRPYLHPEMCKYWDTLVKMGGPS